MTNLLTSISLLMTLTAVPCLAQDSYDVPPGKKLEIDRHAVCRVVENTGDTTFMVPTRAAAEWSGGENSFLAIIPPYVKISACRDKFCPIGSENFRQRQTVDITYAAFSAQDDLVVGQSGLEPFDYDGIYTIFEFASGSWKKAKEYPGLISSRSRFSDDGGRIIATKGKEYGGGATSFALIEINKTATGFSSAATKTVTNLDASKYYDISNLDTGGNAVIAFARTGNAAEVYDRPAYYLQRNSSGVWSRAGILPTPPSLTDAYISSASLTDDATEAYLYGSSGPSSAPVAWGALYRRSGSSWTLVQNFTGSVPVIMSPNGLFAFTTYGSEIAPTYDGGLISWSRKSLGQNFSMLGMTPVSNSPDRRAETCCTNPQSSYDGETVYVMTGGMWSGGGGVLAFRFDGTKFVNRGIAMVDTGTSRRMQDTPSRILFVSGTGKWFGVSQQRGGSDSYEDALFGSGC